MKPISPKLTAGAAIGLIVGLFLQLATTITPDTFAFLGKGEGLAFLVFTIAAAAAAAWAKSDSLRDAGAAAIQAVADEAEKVAASKRAASQESMKATAIVPVNPPVVQAPAAPLETPAAPVRTVVIMEPAPAPEPAAAPTPEPAPAPTLEPVAILAPEPQPALAAPTAAAL